jgi:nitrogen-specific signal transduction histidine kinase
VLRFAKLTCEIGPRNGPGVTVGTQPAGELPPIQCDRVQLQQVMLKLIVNAIQSMSGVEDGNRELHISTVSIEPEGVCLERQRRLVHLTKRTLARLVIGIRRPGRV